MKSAIFGINKILDLMNVVLFKQIKKNKETEVLSYRSKQSTSPEQPGNDKKKL